MKDLLIKKISVILLNIAALFCQFEMAAHTSFICYPVSNSNHSSRFSDLILSISENLFYDVQSTVVFIILMILAIAVFVMNIIAVKADGFYMKFLFYYPIYYFAFYVLFGYMRCLGPETDGEGLGNLLSAAVYIFTLIPISALLLITLLVCLLATKKEKFLGLSFASLIAVLLASVYGVTEHLETIGYTFLTFVLLCIIQMILISMSLVDNFEVPHTYEKGMYYFNGVLTDRVDNIERYFYKNT